MTEPTRTGMGASLRRIGLIARHTLREALHLRLTRLIALAGGGLVFSALELREFNFGGSEGKFLADFGLGALGLSGMLLAALAMAHLFFSSIAGGAACILLTRPVRRWEFVWGKLAGVFAVLALFSAAIGLVLAGLLVWRGIPVATPVFACAVAVLWLKLSLVAAMTLLVCSYAGSALFASSAGLLLALLGHLRPLAGESGRLHWLRVWPDFELFDGGALLAAGQVPPAATLLAVMVYWAGYVMILGQLAAYAFKRREF